jgi:hypothetical protein
MQSGGLADQMGGGARAQTLWLASIPQYAIQNWTISSFFPSWAISAMFIFGVHLSVACNYPINIT